MVFSNINNIIFVLLNKYDVNFWGDSINIVLKKLNIGIYFRIWIKLDIFNN